MSILILSNGIQISLDEMEMVGNDIKQSIVLIQMRSIQQSFQLKELVSLCNSGITDKQLETICEKYTGKVKKLDLQRNTITAAGISFMKNPRWANLRELHLWQNIIGDRGCKFLTQVVFPHLTWLNLIENLIGSMGVFHLCKGRWTRLEELFLTGNRISVGGVVSLAHGDFKRLIKLEIDSNSITKNEGIYLMTFETEVLAAVSMSRNIKMCNDKQQLERNMSQKFKGLTLNI